jgi:predicted RND superfamily exporter protein
VILIFRVPKIWIPALFSLLVGSIWFVGIIANLYSFGLKINFLNFIALPITFGIGVDYGVNVFQRFYEQGSRDIVRVIRETGGAVCLSSLTTIIGYSSLLMASNQGFVSFGVLAILGELACVTTAVIVLPAGLILGFNPFSKTQVNRLD